MWSFVLIDQTASLHPNLHSTAFSLCTKLYEKVSKQPEAAEVSVLSIDRSKNFGSKGHFFMIFLNSNPLLPFMRWRYHD